MRDVAYGVSTEDEARGAVRELAVRKPDFVKIWVDDRNGAVMKLSPRLYRAIIDEAHVRGIRVMAHVYYLADARDLVEAGVDGFLHLVRDEEMDDALVRRMKEKNVFVTPNLSTSEAGTYTDKPAWLDDPALAESATSAMIRKVAETYAARRDAGVAPRQAATTSYTKQLRSLAKLNAAGVPIALGDDTGIENTFFGFGEHRELELMVSRWHDADAGDRRGHAHAGGASPSAGAWYRRSRQERRLRRAGCQSPGAHRQHTKDREVISPRRRSIVSRCVQRGPGAD